MCVAGEMDKTTAMEWRRSIEFHGHACPGLAYGFKAAMIALKELDIEIAVNGIKKTKSNELVAIVENDSSGVDAVQVVTGCSLGNGNLMFRNLGKHVYTFGNRKTGEAVRISVKRGMIRPDLKQQAILQKAKNSGVELAENNLFWSLNLGLAHAILETPDEDLCDVRRVGLEFPGKTTIIESVVCSKCGESVAESMARLKNGKPVCLDCI